MRPEEVTGKEDPVFLEVGEHRLRPVDPGSKDKLKRLSSQGEGLPITDDDEAIFRDMEMIDQEVTTLRVRHHLRAREPVKHNRYRARVILLGVVADDVVDLLHVELLQVPHETGGHRRVDGIDQCCCITSLHQVAVVGGAVRERNQLIEYPAIPVDDTDGEDTRYNLTCGHPLPPPQNRNL